MIEIAFIISLICYILLIPAAFNIDDFETQMKWWLAALILSIVALAIGVYIE